MTIDEQYAPVTHKHPNCPICNSEELIHDVKPVHSDWDRLMASISNFNASMRTMIGKRIEVREEK